uniref:Histidine-rich glycoprotein n=1 Tax=Glossina brevipalpis TaxID=37001 RepID=A0A1A9X0L7_9MUSC
MLQKFVIVLLIGSLLNNCSARPGFLHGHHHHFDYPLIHHHHEPFPIAKYVHIPAAISHQSSTVIHSAPIIKPFVVPVVKTVLPIYKTYHPAPIIKTLHYDPFHHHHFDHHDFHHYH